MTDETLETGKILQKQISELKYLIQCLDPNSVSNIEYSESRKGVKNIKFFHKLRGYDTKYELDLPEGVRQKVKACVIEELKELEAQWEAL